MRRPAQARPAGLCSLGPGQPFSWAATPTIGFQLDSEASSSDSDARDGRASVDVDDGAGDIVVLQRKHHTLGHLQGRRRGGLWRRKAVCGTAVPRLLGHCPPAHARQPALVSLGTDPSTVAPPLQPRTSSGMPGRATGMLVVLAAGGGGGAVSRRRTISWRCGPF